MAPNPFVYRLLRVLCVLCGKRFALDQVLKGRLFEPGCDVVANVAEEAHQLGVALDGRVIVEELTDRADRRQRPVRRICTRNSRGIACRSAVWRILTGPAP